MYLNAKGHDGLQLSELGIDGRAHLYNVLARQAGYADADGGCTVVSNQMLRRIFEYNARMQSVRGA